MSAKKIKSNKIKFNKLKSNKLKFNKAETRNTTRNTKLTKSSSLSKHFKGAAFKFGDIFSFSTKKGKAKKNFSSSFEYENFMINLKGSVKNGKANLNVNIVGKTFNFSGELTVTEKTFNNLHALFDHLLSSITAR